MNKDEQYMRMAIRLARKGAGIARLMVGALVVKDNQVAGSGFAGSGDDLPAVIKAINKAGRLVPDSTIYTNCEPLIDSTDSTHLEQLIAARPERIVIGATVDSSGSDRAPQMLNRLREPGIELTLGVCEAESRQLNEVYMKYSATGLPFVTVKYAQTLDGRIATQSGDSQWISSPPSLRLAHQLRREHDAIMVGIGTVFKDDPRLTVRLVGGRNPLRIVIDSRLRIPLDARLISEKTDRPTVVITSEAVDSQRAIEVAETGAEVMMIPAAPNKPGVSITAALQALGRRAVRSVLVEGGSGIITSLLSAGAVDRMVVVIAPKIIGRGIEAVGDLGIVRLGDAMTFASFTTRRVGPDMVFDGRL